MPIDGKQQERAEYRDRGYQQNDGADDFDDAGKIAKPLSETEQIEFRDHVGVSAQLHERREQK
jgi:hypothetical protein